MKKVQLAKVRIEGNPDAVAALATLLRKQTDVVEESKDYPNRPPSEGVRRYLTVAVEPIPLHT